MAVPLGLIAIWSGTLATIPANWNLCDGTGGTPNLIARFIRGAPAGLNPGAIGGSDNHTHASMTAAGTHNHTLAIQNHSHTTNSSGSHTHGPGVTGGGAVVVIMTLSAGSHTHTTSSSGHSHTSTADANHTHTINPADGRPPYYEVAFIQAGAGAAVALGLIIIWTGTIANIPVGWALCDGGGGRPDLRSRFLRGVNTNITNPGTTGGALTHIHTEQNRNHDHGGASTVDGSHFHTHTAFTWTHNHNAAISILGGLANRQNDTHAGDHTHSNTDTIGSHSHTIGSGGDHTHTVNPASSLPAYYTVAYIINVSAGSIPVGGILIWTGILANIPSGFGLCDGLDGKPELRAKFIYGAAPGNDPGALGGSDTHTHTDVNAGVHSDHLIGLSGAHQHAATNSIGAHTHAVAGAVGNAGVGTLQSNLSSGSHSHTYNNENSHTHTIDSLGDHNHNPWSTDDGRPAYYEVAFVIYMLETRRGSFFMMFS